MPPFPGAPVENPWIPCWGGGGGLEDGSPAPSQIAVVGAGADEVVLLGSRTPPGAGLGLASERWGPESQASQAGEMGQERVLVRLLSQCKVKGVEAELASLVHRRPDWSHQEQSHGYL